MRNTRRIKEALTLFESGNNCAQSVLLPYCEQYSCDMEMAKHLTAGFGSGMGKLQKTCGAVTGAFMVIGLHSGTLTNDNNDKKKLSTEKIQYFHHQFLTEHQNSDCKRLLGCDLTTEKGQRIFEEKDLKHAICAHCIATAVNILEELIGHKV